MGVQISEIIPKEEFDLSDLTGKRIAIDAFNTLYQFLSIIRDRFTGEPLKDSEGRVTSHLSGLFYRTTNLIEKGMKPVFVFDGEPPAFKKETTEARREVREQAKKKWEEAVKSGEPAIKYAQIASRLTGEMIDSSKQLLDLMGIPWVQAPSEGEMQCAYMCKKKDVWATGSQDYDSILVGSPRMVRNLSISGRKKLPRKETYVEVRPEIIILENVLKHLGLDEKQLIVLGILVGTDYNPGGVRGYGPKRALELVKEAKTLDNVLKKVEWTHKVSAQQIFDFFQNPTKTDDYKLEWKEPNINKLIEFMVNEHSFSMDRVEKTIEKLHSAYSDGVQSSLGSWLKK